MLKREASEFNKWLVKNGHADRSKSVMCSKEANELFGDPFYVFIAGNYKYTWLRANDVNEDDSKTGWYFGMVPDFLFGSDSNHTFFGPEHLRQKKYKRLKEVDDLGAPPSLKDDIVAEIEQEIEEWLHKEFPTYFTTNKGISTAWVNNYEIWFQCKGYYFVRDDRALIDQMKRMVK